MKKLLVLFVAVLIAVPAISFAGSATSRWDMTIGGFVKADFGYADQGVSADSFIANRKSGHSVENAFDEYGNYFNAAGETRLNFLIKGPDAWGAKSSAFIEGDFRGAWGGGSTNYGVFQLRHAFMKFDWPDSSLIVGKTWQPWGVMPCFCVLNVNELGPFNKGVRQPQITFIKSFTKEFSGTISLFSPINELASVSGENWVDSYSRYPQLAGELNFKSDMMGKIGPWMLQAGLGGFIGKQKIIYNEATGSPVATQATWGAGGNVAAAASFSDEEETIWGLSLKGFIPIIREAKAGDKTGSLGFGWDVFTGQGWNGPYNPGAIQVATINRGNGDFANPNFWGGWGQLFFYLTDKVSFNAQYGQLKYNVSHAVRNSSSFANAPLEIKHYIFNAIYDVNAAVRVGAQISRVYTKYMGAASGLKDDGAFNEFRVAAYYFF